MKSIVLSFILIIFTIGLKAQAQVQDPILFYVEDRPVNVTEFDYIYNKNNGDKADYSKNSLQEYLDLYINFKLKVQRAREMGLDTVKSLKKELAGYRKQLAQSYLVDNEVSDQLIKEVFERKKHDLKISHILVRSTEKDNEEKQKKALVKINSIKKMIDLGKSFEGLARELSDDRQSKNSYGNLGFVTSMLPDGFYNFENAVYDLELGQISDVVKSNLGYHLIKLTDKRKARGEMDVAHILVSKKIKNKNNPNAKMQIDSVYQLLVDGGNFEELCKLYSQDKKTSNRGGRLGFFGINRYESTFENVAFALEKDGDLSEIVETHTGWHIIKRLRVKDLNDFSSAQKTLKNIVSKSARFDIAKDSLIEKIKNQGGFTEYPNVYNHFVKNLDKTFFSYKWKYPVANKDLLFSFKNNQNGNVKEFVNFCKKESKIRLRFNKNMKIEDAVDKLYQMYVNSAAIIYEETNLENKYPEFKALMREYNEGILLFEATEKEVWNKASSDTLGLRAFYNENKNDYKWGERARVIEYKLKTANAKEFKKIWKDAKKMNTEDVIKKYNINNTLIVSYREMTLNKGDQKLYDIKWKNKSVSKPLVDTDKNETIFYQIKEKLSARLKKLSEARGYIISDYQDRLEKEWIINLKEKYEIVLNQEVFNSLIKK